MLKYEWGTEKELKLLPFSLGAEECRHGQPFLYLCVCMCVWGKPHYRHTSGLALGCFTIMLVSAAELSAWAGAGAGGWSVSGELIILFAQKGPWGPYAPPVGMCSTRLRMQRANIKGGFVTMMAQTAQRVHHPIPIQVHVNAMPTEEEETGINARVVLSHGCALRFNLPVATTTATTGLPALKPTCRALDHHPLDSACPFLPEPNAGDLFLKAMHGSLKADPVSMLDTWQTNPASHFAHVGALWHLNT